MEFIHQYLLKNGKIIPNVAVSLNNEYAIYEIIRIIEGVPLFIEHHFQRLLNTSMILQKTVPITEPEFGNSIEKLILSNGILTGNVKISLALENGPEIHKYIMGFISHQYPTLEAYNSGIKIVSCTCERPNPNAKVQNDDLRKKLNDLIKKEAAYEALLIHPDGYITECSRSNIFFIKGNTVFTAPDKDVLAGITRNMIIEICHQNDHDILLQTINYADLKYMEAAFITGTSPKVLAVNAIDTFKLQVSHKIIRAISYQYDKLIASYIAAHQKKT